MPLSANDLKTLQRQQWGEKKEGATVKKKPVVKLTPVRKPNKYLNIIRKDIICLKNVLSESWSPIGWFRMWRYRQSGEYRDFMEQHFGRNAG